MPSSPSSRCRMRIGVGTPAATQMMVSSLPSLDAVDAHRVVAQVADG